MAKETSSPHPKLEKAADSSLKILSWHLAAAELLETAIDIKDLLGGMIAVSTASILDNILSVAYNIENYRINQDDLLSFVQDANSILDENEHLPIDISGSVTTENKIPLAKCHSIHLKMLHWSKNVSIEVFDHEGKKIWNGFRPSMYGTKKEVEAFEKVYRVETVNPTLIKEFVQKAGLGETFKDCSLLHIDMLHWSKQGLVKGYIFEKKARKNNRINITDQALIQKAELKDTLKDCTISHIEILHKTQEALVIGDSKKEVKIKSRDLYQNIYNIITLLKKFIIQEANLNNASKDRTISHTEVINEIKKLLANSCTSKDETHIKRNHDKIMITNPNLIQEFIQKANLNYAKEHTISYVDIGGSEKALVKGCVFKEKTNTKRKHKIKITDPNLIQEFTKKINSEDKFKGCSILEITHNSQEASVKGYIQEEKVHIKKRDLYQKRYHTIEVKDQNKIQDLIKEKTLENTFTECTILRIEMLHDSKEASVKGYITRKTSVKNYTLKEEGQIEEESLYQDIDQLIGDFRKKGDEVVGLAEKKDYEKDKVEYTPVKQEFFQKYAHHKTHQVIPNHFESFKKLAEKAYKDEEPFRDNVEKLYEIYIENIYSNLHDKEVLGYLRNFIKTEIEMPTLPFKLGGMGTSKFKATYPKASEINKGMKPSPPSPEDSTYASEGEDCLKDINIYNLRKRSKNKFTDVTNTSEINAFSTAEALRHKLRSELITTLYHVHGDKIDSEDSTEVLSKTAVVDVLNLTLQGFEHYSPHKFTYQDRQSTNPLIHPHDTAWSEAVRPAIVMKFRKLVGDFTLQEMAEYLESDEKIISASVLKELGENYQKKYTASEMAELLVKNEKILPDNEREISSALQIIANKNHLPKHSKEEFLEALEVVKSILYIQEIQWYKCLRTSQLYEGLYRIFSLPFIDPKNNIFGFAPLILASVFSSYLLTNYMLNSNTYDLSGYAETLRDGIYAFALYEIGLNVIGSLYFLCVTRGAHLDSEILNVTKIPDIWSKKFNQVHQNYKQFQELTAFYSTDLATALMLRNHTDDLTGSMLFTKFSILTYTYLQSFFPENEKLKAAANVASELRITSASLYGTFHFFLSGYVMIMASKLFDVSTSAVTQVAEYMNQHTKNIGNNQNIQSIIKGGSV